MSNERYIWAGWPAPNGVNALVTTRKGGLSEAGFSSFNLGLYSGDDQETVRANRQLLNQDLDLARSPLWLKQVHGVEVADADTDNQETEADASVSRTTGSACAVLTADCLPVLFCNLDGTVVAAAHAGWKGLVAGILEATVHSMGVPPETVMAWLGPAIGQHNFEIGPEVRAQFLAEDSGCFGAFNPGREDRWFANLNTLARRRLNRLGVNRVYGGEFCSYDQSDLFYSYRRDGKSSGRMASLIWRVPTMP
ncbi:peptidoglycan editing factor PgeF [Endozoicomonas sp. SCSIO W0465]|uniref:peptidoglycan editing factor PgeF n=1 Tax=Endozoicomonas sp. SCSIO W0465 TaxID=2918516 RepID=UPI002075A072|nr:peptidoglycan editing factor PgeF [Endozoicomonas sp. SCSIO W0465]USE34862.1 peptidoglycan editing factor PgeF [Endozoicomonas sp. SCSIO W0465]